MHSGDLQRDYDNRSNKKKSEDVIKTSDKKNYRTKILKDECQNKSGSRNNDIETADSVDPYLTVTAEKESKDMPTGIRMKQVNRKIIISHISEDSIFKGLLKVGSEIISINGVSARDCHNNLASMAEVIRDAESTVTVTVNEEFKIKEAHLCCICCCDCRTAVITLNGLSLILASIVLILVATNNETISSVYDETQVNRTLLMATTAFSILFYLIGVAGAMKYSVCMVVATGMWYCVEFGLTLVSKNFIGAIIPVLVAYPHFVLIGEMLRGITTPENYQRRWGCSQ